MKAVALMDPGGTPHYFGPYPNYANSPLPTGAIASVTVESGGSGYTAPVVELYDLYGVGSGATATATVSGGIVTSVTITSGGSGYNAPKVSITDPTGTGAVATAAIGGDLSGGIRKFVDSLPGLGEENANNLGNYIPVAYPDKTTYPGCDYYEIALVQFSEKMHSDLPETLLRGYVQLETSANAAVSKHILLQNPDGSPILLANGTQAIGFDNPHYFGPTIVSQRDTPTRIKFSNLLPTGAGGDLFLPVDTTVMGSGMGALASVHHVMVMDGGSGYTSAPDVTFDGGGGSGAAAMAMLVGDVVDHVMVTDGGVGYTSAPTVMFTGGGGSGAMADSMIMFENHTENRATLHLHGGFVPWISDGTPHQWTTPAGEVTQYPKGVSVQYVPDMWFVNGSVVPNTIGQTTPPVANATNDPGDGSLTFYYNNQQSARLMFYHDHAYGITRLNVYAGEAAGYLLTDPVEEELIDSGVIPSLAGVYRYGIPLVIQDKTFVDATTIPYQDPTWAWGSLPPGTPSTGDLWMPHVYMPNQNPYDVSGMNAFGRWHYGPWFWPPTTDVTYGPVANPYYDPINAPWEPPMIPGTPSNSMAMEAFMDTPTVNGVAYPYLEVDPQAYRFRVLSVGNDRFFNLQLYVADPDVVTWDGRTDTEVRMVPAVATPGYPPLWPTDGRDGGAPDPATAGPSFIQIGTEGGFLPAPAVLENQPVTWNLDPTTFTMGNVQDHTLLLGPAERADVIIDFSAYAGKTLILYNDAPAAFPARDARYDYYTGDPDLTDTGGAPTTQVGYGPNMRTVMQIRVADIPPAPSFSLGALEAMFASSPDRSGVFESSQDTIIVPQAAYNSAYGKTFPEDTYARIMDTSLTFETVSGTTLTIPFQQKAIQDEMGEAFEVEYGRMSGMLGVEVTPATAGAQNLVLYGYPSPPVDVLAVSLTAGEPIAGDGTQIWKITHNGVDTHTLHTHLYSMQLINRVAWDNAVSAPDANELGWKETLRVNPLEDTIVAVRPVSPTQPFEVPNSVRPIDVTMPLGAVLPGPPGGFKDPQGQPVTVTNHLVNFGWEYVMHCHLLGHEEMDMMHGVVIAVPPLPPEGLAGIYAGTDVNLTWTDGSISETAYIVQRSTSLPSWTTIATLPSPLDGTGPSRGTLMYYNDTVVADGTIYYYRVLANKVVGDTEVYAASIGFPTASANSTPSSTLAVDTGLGTVTVLLTSPAPAPALMSAPSTPSSLDASSLSGLALPSSGLGASYIDHAPIRIDSDLDFDSAHGVSGGDGTVGTPWIIENLRIDGAGYGYGIYVGNTTDYFVIRDSYLYGAAGGTSGWPYTPDSGLVLNNVTNGIAAGNVFTGNAWAGAYVYMCQGVALYNNTATSNYMGIYVRSSSYSTFDGNVVSGNYAGIWAYGSTGNVISNNSVSYNFPGMLLAASDGNLVADNSVFQNTYYGIWSHGSSGNRLFDNDLLSNHGSGTVYSSLHVQGYDDSSNMWNGSASGNHWRDWTTIDSDLDGIVDEPYLLDGGAGARDYYPCMAPLIAAEPTSIVVLPSVLAIAAGATQVFTATVYDQYGNAVEGSLFDWSTDVGSMTDSSFTAQAVSGVSGHVWAVSGLLTGEASVSVVPGALDHIDLTPATLGIVAGGNQQFTASGKDAYGNAVAGLTYSWSTTVGNVSDTGLFIAQMTAGVSGYVNASADGKTGSATVTILIDQLTHIVVTPSVADVVAGATQDFTAVGYDQYSNVVTGLTFTWTTSVGTMTGATLTAQTTAGPTGFVRAQVGLVSGEAYVTVVAGSLDHIDVAPSSLSALAGSQTQFSAVGKDVYGNAISGLTFSWTTTVGSITSAGLFTAQTVAGVSGYVNASSGLTNGSADVSIVTDQVTHIVVDPSAADVAAGATHDFTAAGYDQYDNVVTGLTFTWTTNVGTMAGPTLTAQTVAGASGYVRASYGLVSGIASVTIVPGALDHVDVTPSSLSALPASVTQFSATARDVYGNAISGAVFEWSTTVGSITVSGLFTAQTLAGVSGYVNASTDGVEGSADVTVVTDQLAYIVVTPGAVEVVVGTDQDFSAAGYDQYWNVISGATFAWTTDIGSMTDHTLTAQTVSGVTGYVRASSGSVSDDASVTIMPGDLDHIDVSPSEASVSAGSEMQFSATGRDVYNNAVPDLTFAWTTDVGSVSDGLFTAQTVAGASGYVNASVGDVEGSAAVTVVPGQLTYIVVTPGTTDVAAGESQAFSATGYDWYGNDISGLVFVWTTDVGTMVGSDLTAQTVADVSGYVRATSGPTYGQSLVTIVPNDLDYIDMSPSAMTIAAGQDAQFAATGRDVYGNAISDLVFSWTTDVGDVTDEGLFTAQETAGVDGYVNASVGEVTGSTSVTVVPGQLTHIVVTPGSADIVAGASEEFAAVGYDQYDNTIEGLVFTWSTDVGTTEGPVLTAQTVAGATGVMTASYALVSGSALVRIVPGELDHVDVSPETVVAAAGSETVFEATALDMYNNTISGVTFVWTTTVGTVTDSGVFTAQETSGVTGYVRASSGGKMGSASVSIVPGQLVYIVVTPGTADVVAGTSEEFTATGYDLYGNAKSGIVFSWTTDVGEVSDGTLTADTVSGASGYVKASSGPVSGQAAVSIIPADPDRIDMSPTDLNATAGMQTQFHATVLDMYDNTISGLPETWTSTVGTVTSAGLFTAQTVAGVSGFVNVSSGGVDASAEVTVVPDQLTHIVVTEDEINVTAGTFLNFTAMGYDQYGNQIPGLEFTWTTNIGTMTGNMFRAQNESGVTGYVRATSGLVSGEASVSVVPKPSEGLSIGTISTISGLALAIIVFLVFLLMWLRMRSKPTPDDDGAGSQSGRMTRAVRGKRGG